MESGSSSKECNEEGICSRKNTMTTVKLYSSLRNGLTI